MRTTKIISASANIILVLATILFLLDSLENFDIKSNSLKTITFLIFLFGTPIVLIWNTFQLKARYQKILGILFPIVNIIFIVSIGFANLAWSSSAWETDRILYQNKHFRNKAIEQQVENVGDHDPRRRTVEVIYLTKAFIVVNSVPSDVDKRIEWTKINNPTNEVGNEIP